MPRNSQGLYTLPPGNPVTPGTLIEADWANTTLPDIAQALTDSLPRNGSAAMTGPLTLTSALATQGRHAASNDKMVRKDCDLIVDGMLPAERIAEDVHRFVMEKFENGQKS